MEIEVKQMIFMLILVLVIAYLNSNWIRKLYTYSNLVIHNKYYKNSMNIPQSMMKIDQVISVLKNRLYREKSMSLSHHLQRIIFGSRQGEQRKLMQKLLADWTINKQADIDDLLINFNKAASYKLKELQYFPQSQVLSARVYISFHLFIQKVKDISEINKPQFTKLGRYLRQNNIQVAYHRYLLTASTYKKSHRSLYFNSSEPQEEEKSMKALLDLQKWCVEEECQDMIKVLSFLRSIKIIDNYSSSQNEKQKVHQDQSSMETSHNIFMQNLQRISKQQQKEMYCKNMGIAHWQAISQNKLQAQHLKKLYPNYFFYSKYNQNHICLETKAYNYDYLQSRHDYIQWMFPNHYGSSFNSQAAPLNYIEKYIFLHDRSIALNMLISVNIFFDFMGLSVSLSTQKGFELDIIDQQRLKDVILVNHHNHLRLMRIFACLSVIGFRALALKLIESLDYLTHHSHTQQFRYHFANQRQQFLRQWKIYGNNENGQTEKAKSMCFLQATKFPQLHILLREFVQKSAQQIKIQQLVSQQEIQEEKERVLFEKEEEPKAIQKNQLFHESSENDQQRQNVIVDQQKSQQQKIIPQTQPNQLSLNNEGLQQKNQPRLGQQQVTNSSQYLKTIQSQNKS